MTKQAADGDEGAATRETVAQFKKAVNMTPAQLEKWLDTDDSRRVGQKSGNAESTGHQSGRRIVELLHRKAQDLSAADIAHMRKVVGYIHRHLAQGPTKSDPASSDWRYSLMNWGHDPEKD